MNRAQFITRFQMSPLPPLEDPLAAELGSHPKLRDAAVLIALEEHDKQLHILLTERTADMPTHAGQIAFPGGKVDRGDASPFETAVRESWEEIGLPRNVIEHVGELAPFHTISRFRVWPQIAFINAPFEPILSEREVARLFRAPLQDFLDPQQRWRVPIKRRQGEHSVYFMPHQVWGATAAMLEQLVRQLGYGKAPVGP
ncbi:CoA pyrophosphatase [Ferrimonas pelagia]|uniref:CoA pyrophosphatase n=1 Tax=Ferrimonas pelagia TaxID=1177826 RepID=A0ABP9FDN5_9GAMM